MNKTPYAYSFEDSSYDENKIFPTLDLAVKYLKDGGWLAGYAFEYSPIKAHFCEREPEQISLKDFIVANNVDEKEVADYIDGLINASLEKEKQTLEAIKNGAPGVLVTGSAPLHRLNRNDLIKREIDKRKYSWK